MQERGANSTLSRPTKTSEVTVPSVNTGPLIPAPSNAHHTVDSQGATGWLKYIVNLDDVTLTVFQFEKESSQVRRNVCQYFMEL
jgi:hypothetical protein